MDEEAEELGDGDVYEEDEEPRLGTLPPHTPQRGAPLATTQTEGSLLGDEFTSPHAIKKGD